MIMGKSAGTSVLLGLALLLAPMMSMATEVSWNNVNGGDWNEPTNWSTGVVPQATDTVYITLDGTYIVVMDSTPTVLALTIGGADGVQTLQITGALTVDGAVLAGDSAQIVILGSTEGTASLTAADSLMNHGAIVLSSSDTDSTNSATLAVTNGALTNHSNGVITATTGSSEGGARTIDAELVNDGAILADQIALNLTKDPAMHVNNGSIILDGGDFNIIMALKMGAATAKGPAAPPSIVNTGLIRLGAATQFSVTGGGIFNDATGTIAGAGELEFSTSAFANDGTIEPGDTLGRLSLTGDLYNSSNAQLHIEIGGPTVGTDCDQFAVSGMATLDGAMDFALVNDYAPAVGDSVKIMTFGSKLGGFVDVQGFTAGGYVFDTSWAADGLYIVCKDAPNSPPDWSGLPDSVDFRWDSSAIVNVFDGVSDTETDDTLLLFEFRITNTAAHLGWNSENGNLVITADSGLDDYMYLILDATDEEAATSTDTVVVTVRPAIVNEPPVWSGLPDTIRIMNDSVFQFSLWDHVEDPETEDSLLGYGFEAHPDTLLASMNTTTGVASLWCYPGYEGEILVIVGAFDPQFHTGRDTIIMVVSAPNTPPVFSGLPDTLEFDIADTDTLMLFDYLSDAETPESLLVIDLNRSPLDIGYAYTAATGELLIFSMDDWSGTGALYLSATDPDSAKVRDTIVIKILPETRAGDGHPGRIPTEFVLNQNWPNPFNPTTSIEFGLPAAAHTVVSVYNVLGARVAVLIDQTLPAGYHTATWDGTLTNGSAAASGIYFYRIEADQFVSVRKMVLLK